jgi:hypothetical protein
MRGLNQAISKYRLLTGSSEFDDLLGSDSNGYLAMLTTGNTDGLELELRNQAETLRNFGPGFSSEVRITDRTMRFPTLFTQEGSVYGAPLAGVFEADPRLIFSTLTGEPGDGMYFPLNGVRWLTPPRDFAALVHQNSRERFLAEVFHFGIAPRAMEIELLLLKPGAYILELVNARTGEMLYPRLLPISNDTRRISIEIPPQILCRIDVQAREEHFSCTVTDETERLSLDGFGNSRKSVVAREHDPPSCLPVWRAVLPGSRIISISPSHKYSILLPPEKGPESIVVVH